VLIFQAGIFRKIIWHNSDMECGNSLPLFSRRLDAGSGTQASPARRKSASELAHSIPECGTATLECGSHRNPKRM